MRLVVAAVGRLRPGPEKTLVDDYLQRAGRTGRPLGLGPVTVSEVDDRKGGGRPAEAAALAKAVSPGGLLVALDERGRTMTSPAFAAQLAEWRDGGTREAVFAIGGADGLDPELVARADTVLSFGPMVWPHMLARVMLAEQIYRATTILAGAPYHRS